MPESQQADESTQLFIQKILSLPRPIRVLDCGSGPGKWGRLLKGRVDRIDGIEVFQGYIDRYDLASLYNGITCCDLRDIPPEVLHGGYDVAILGDVLEHMTWAQAVDFITKLKGAISHILLSIPVTVCIQTACDGNPYEEHLYQWSDKEIRDVLGFTALRFDTNENHLVCVGAYEWRRA